MCFAQVAYVQFECIRLVGLALPALPSPRVYNELYGKFSTCEDAGELLQNEYPRNL